AVSGMKLRHIFEVHPVDAGYRGWYGEDRRPCRKPLGNRSDPLLLEQAADLEHGAERVAQARHSRLDPRDMVLDVTEIDPRLTVDAWQLLSSELHRDFFHRDEDSLQPTELPPKGEDVPDLIAIEEALGGFRLHLEHLFADVIDQRRIAVDDII